MRYWLLTTEYPPFHGGGISTYCHQTAELFANMGIGITVFVPDDSIRDHEMTAAENGIRILRFHSNRSGSDRYLGYAARLSYEFSLIVRDQIALEGKPDMIEAQDYLGIACYLLQFKQLLYEDLKGIPIVLTLHSPAFLYLEYNRVPTATFPEFWIGEMEKQAIKMADHLISPTRFLADTVKRWVDLAGREISIIRNPFHVSSHGLFRIVRNRIVCFGKLSRQKGSFEMLPYFRDLWDEGFPHPLHIIGGTDIVYHPEGLTMGQIVNRDYRTYIKKGLLQIHGKIAPANLSSALASAHVIIVPSIVDNLPYVIIEAMSLGKTVLASIQGGQREMIDAGVNGFLFDHELPGDFKERLIDILALSDRELEAIGRAAMEKTAEMYDPPIIGRQKTDLFNTIIHRKSEIIRFPFLHQENINPAIGSLTIGSPADRAPTLSVVIPYYNMGRYISDAIASVRASSFADIEILVIDDGSTDKDSIAALELLKEDRDIKIYRKRNEGLAGTRNFGAALATGEFLAFLDADDKVSPDYYEKTIRILQWYENVFFAGAWVRYFGNSSREWATFMPQPPYLMIHNPVNSSGLVYKKAAFLVAGLNDKQVDYGLEDYDSVIGMMAAGYNGIILPEFLFYYRIRDDSMSRKINRAKFLYSYKYISQKHAAYYAKFAAGIFNLLNANGPGFLYDNPTFEVRVSVTSENQNRLLMNIKAVVKKNKLLKRLAMKMIKK